MVKVKFSKRTAIIVIFVIILLIFLSQNLAKKSEIVSASFTFDASVPGDGVHISYTDEHLSVIKKVAKKYEIENPFLPKKDLGSDYVMEIRLEDNHFAIIYPHFSVRQSNVDFITSENKREEVTLKSNGTAYWIENERTLFLTRDDITIAITSAKSVEKDEFIAIADSLVMLEEVLAQ